VDGRNVLTSMTLEHLPAHDGPKEVYAAGCRFSKARLERKGITFKQTPYAIALQTGRGKDFARLVTFAEARAANDAKLHDILARHRLEAA
jgi:hypothetical protein